VRITNSRKIAEEKRRANSLHSKVKSLGSKILGSVKSSKKPLVGYHIERVGSPSDTRQEPTQHTDLARLALGLPVSDGFRDWMKVVAPKKPLIDPNKSYPTGSHCPSCRSRSIYHRNTRVYTYRCRRCGNQFN